MIEKEFPVFAFEEIRRCGVSQGQNKNEMSFLKAFLEKEEIERKPKSSVLNIFVENSMQQFIRARLAFYQTIRYKNYILIQFLIEFYDIEDVNDNYFRIENCNKLLIEKGQEGMKNIYKMLTKEKTPEFLEEFRTFYNLHFIDCIRKSKNPIQVEKTDQEQTLKITYKIDL